MSNLEEPISREDFYLAYLNGENVELPEPVSRVDKYLYNLCINGSSGNIKAEVEKLSSQLDTKASEVDLKTLESRMNSFTSLNEGSTTGDAELIDGRIGLSATYSNIGEHIRDNEKKINELNIIMTGNDTTDIVQYTISVDKYTKSLFVEKDITTDKKYYLKLVSCSVTYFNNISCFFYRSDSSYSSSLVQFGVTNPEIGVEYTFTPTEDFVKLRLNVNVTETELAEGKCIFEFGEYTENEEGIIKELNAIKESIGNINNNINFLIFGDSYSAQKRWIKSMQNFLNINDSNIINLGVSGARLRDSYSDRVTYPYSSRPVLNAPGNNNILASQIEKLKRLMTGTDLDSGETQIYENTTPDIILIELGKNDYSDNDTKYENYLYEIFEKIEDNYVKTSATSTPTVRNVYKPKDVENLDRTCFVGALAYAYSELHKIFPKALIFFISNSNLWNLTTEPDRDYRKHYQIKKACELMSIPLIDWYAEGLTPNFLAYWEGEGTESNPYLSYLPSELTLDELHPNDKGAELLGLKTATYIEPYLKFINKLQYQ